MKGAAQIIADFVAPSLRPDIDPSGLANSTIEHLRSYGWHLERAKEEPDNSRRRFISSSTLQVYCAALTGIMANSDLRIPPQAYNQGAIADMAMAAVDAFIERTR